MFSFICDCFVLFLFTLGQIFGFLSPSRLLLFFLWFLDKVAAVLKLLQKEASKSELDKDGISQWSQWSQQLQQPLGWPAGPFVPPQPD